MWCNLLVCVYCAVGVVYCASVCVRTVLYLLLCTWYTVLVCVYCAGVCLYCAGVMGVGSACTCMPMCMSIGVCVYGCTMLTSMCGLGMYTLNGSTCADGLG